MPPVVAAALPAEITSRPMLMAFYEYLAQCGRKGATKEHLAEKVWEESYNPTIHDTRIYKTVARLRKLLGDNKENPNQLVQVGRQYILYFPHTNHQSGDRK
jgi:DNA-binding winged helix-turn-helix (wHTH) protein